MPYIRRSIEAVFKKLNTEYPVLLMTGSRQTGKTTTLQILLEEEDKGREYISLDNFVERKMAKEEPGMFFQIHKPPVFIDEVQYAPELFPYIKLYVDRTHTPGSFWLSGSQLFKTMHGVQESLAGRIALLHMPPLSQQEINGNAELPAFALDLDSLLMRRRHAKPATISEIYARIYDGGMPALVSGIYSNRDIFYRSYVDTYLYRDVKELSSAIDSLKFVDFLTATAANTAQQVNFRNIAEHSDIDQSTAKSWLRILESLGIVFLLRPFSNNTLKRMIKTPKLYFSDTGLATFLTRWSTPETLQNGAMNGAILENYVISEFIKSYQNTGHEPYIYYYRDKDAREIDVLWERDGCLHPMEIKKTAHPGSQLTGAFKLLDKSTLKRGMGAVVCMADNLGALDSDNLIIPVWLI